MSISSSSSDSVDHEPLSKCSYTRLPDHFWMIYIKTHLHKHKHMRKLNLDGMKKVIKEKYNLDLSKKQVLERFKFARDKYIRGELIINRSPRIPTNDHIKVHEQIVKENSKYISKASKRKAQSACSSYST